MTDTIVHDDRTDADRPRPRVGRRIRTLGVAGGLAVAVLAGAGAVDVLPDWGSLFAQETVDRSPAPVLVALQDLARFDAASGTFQVLVDVERGTPNVPSVISGERATFFAVGRVDAYVDFAALGPDQVSVSPDRRSATITLPAPTVGTAVIDPAQSRVVGRERGLLERVGSIFEDSPVDDQELYVLAGRKIEEDAARSDLSARAEENTQVMLTSLLGSLGYENVVVTYRAVDRP